MAIRRDRTTSRARSICFRGEGAPARPDYESATVPPTRLSIAMRPAPISSANALIVLCPSGRGVAMANSTTVGTAQRFGLEVVLARRRHAVPRQARCRGCRRRCRCRCPTRAPRAPRGSSSGTPRLISSVSPIALWIAAMTPKRSSSMTLLDGTWGQNRPPSLAELVRAVGVVVVDPVAPEVAVERHLRLQTLVGQARPTACRARRRACRSRSSACAPTPAGSGRAAPSRRRRGC